MEAEEEAERQRLAEEARKAGAEGRDPPAGINMWAQVSAHGIARYNAMQCNAMQCNAMLC